MKPFSKKNIVCLGGGIGTANLIRGLKEYTDNIHVVVSMADDGGSAGRLRRIYSMPPPGDVINCMFALSNVDKTLKDLLVFRFAGNRYGGQWTLSGHKLGNLMLTALTSTTGSFTDALAYMQKLFKITGEISPATNTGVEIKAETSDGVIVEGEENIDLGKYNGRRSLEKVSLVPKNAKASRKALEAIRKADVIIAGPGDLYTTILPVLLVEKIREAIEKSNALKVFIVNVANKPFETPHYKVSDYADAITKHFGSPIFQYFLVNTNRTPKIPQKFKYEYVILDTGSQKALNGMIRKADLVDEDFPLYHDAKKLSSFVKEICR